MDILLTLHKLLAYYRRNRQVGHTTFARTIANVGGVVICANEQQANEVARKWRGEHAELKPTTISIQRITDLDARQPVPAVLDNYTVMIICEKAIDRIMTQDDYISKLKEEYQILSRHHEASKLAWSQELQGQQKHCQQRIEGLEGQLSGWKRIARAFRFANPNYAPAYIAKRRR